MDYVGIGVLVTAVGAVLVNLLIAWRTSGKLDVVTTKVDAVEAQIIVQTEKVDETLAETKVVKGHVNSAATKAAVESDGLRKEMAMLREQLSDERQRAALLAQSVATIAQSTIAVQAGVEELNGHGQDDNLKRIDKNTAETARNTARTDAAVDEMKKSTQ